MSRLQFHAESGLLNDDWSRYNSKTDVAFRPKHMSPEEPLEGYHRFQRCFYSLRSFVQRMRVSRTRIVINFLMNLGYGLSLPRT